MVVANNDFSDCCFHDNTYDEAKLEVKVSFLSECSELILMEVLIRTCDMINQIDSSIINGMVVKRIDR